MARGNGQSEINPVTVDAEHELPSAEESEDAASQEATEPGGQASGAAATTSVPDVQQLQAERDNLLDRLARSQAEFENARKRAAREQQEFRDYALSDAIKILLPILDSFERALQSQEKQTGDFRSGVELIYKQLLDALAKLGVEPIEAVGQPFDPRYHQAIEMVATDKVPDHHVLDELQRGYKIKGRLLRPAMVRVATHSNS
jgi:molecular chaperone GrpE